MSDTPTKSPILPFTCPRCGRSHDRGYVNGVDPNQAVDVALGLPPDENHAKKIAWVNEWFRSDHRRSNGCTATTGERILTAQQIVGLLDAWETARLRLDYGRCQYCKAEVPSHCNTCASCADERGP